MLAPQQQSAQRRSRRSIRIVHQEDPDDVLVLEAARVAGELDSLLIEIESLAREHYSDPVPRAARCLLSLDSSDFLTSSHSLSHDRIKALLLRIPPLLTEDTLVVSKTAAAACVALCRAADRLRSTEPRPPLPSERSALLLASDSAELAIAVAMSVCPAEAAEAATAAMLQCDTDASGWWSRAGIAVRLWRQGALDGAVLNTVLRGARSSDAGSDRRKAACFTDNLTRARTFEIQKQTGRDVLFDAARPGLVVTLRPQTAAKAGIAERFVATVAAVEPGRVHLVWEPPAEEGGGGPPSFINHFEFPRDGSETADWWDASAGAQVRDDATVAVHAQIICSVAATAQRRAAAAIPPFQPVSPALTKERLRLAAGQR
eukprot:TRINITY_DN19329_c0_g1_i4.p1 TRINITY_DN19329_c0_g1~~TRINITY_DN19329_c0_g1_i4.p1  ORF type:complete len:374 (+),score=136.98 TRINITY_DN19329_c0_g1_i4:81-1202(+)